MRTPWLLPLLWGCGEHPQKEVVECGPGETHRMVVSTLAFTLPDESGYINGFNLDDHVTSSGEAEGCGHADMVSSDGTEGIDSAFSNLAPVLDLIGASQVEDYLQTAIDSGELLLILEISDLDAPLSAELTDQCATLTLSRAYGDPYIGTDNTLLSDQTFHRDADAPATEPVVVTIEDGVLRAEGIDLTLPVQLLDEYVTLIINQSNFHVTFDTQNNASGYFAGGLPVDVLEDRLSQIKDIGDLSEVIPEMVGSAADLYPDDSGECTDLSLGLDFTSKPVFFYDE
jgi:hypothetical protein